MFPLDILPPLYQWTPRAHQNPDAGTGTPVNFDAIYIHLSSAPYYDYKGYFSKPSSLAAAQNFVRHPIPKAVWAAATNSAAGSTLSVEIVLSAGGKAYGPLTQTYKIALAPFNGRIYYQSYATAFVTNSITREGNVKWDPNGRFGAATLSIRRRRSAQARRRFGRRRKRLWLPRLPLRLRLRRSHDRAARRPVRDDVELRFQERQQETTWPRAATRRRRYTRATRFAGRVCHPTEVWASATSSTSRATRTTARTRSSTT